MNGIARGVLNACAKASRSSEWRTRLGAARVLEVLGAVLSPLMTPGTVSPDPGGGELLGPHKSKVVAVLKDLRYGPPQPQAISHPNPVLQG